MHFWYEDVSKPAVCTMHPPRLLSVSVSVVELLQLDVDPKAALGLMWVTPAATGLRFVYLGMEAGTQETQQESNTELEAADITGNIKLLCYISRSGNWITSILMLSTRTLSHVPVSAFCSFLGRASAFLRWHLGKFIVLRSHPSIKSASLPEYLRGCQTATAHYPPFVK